MTKEIFIITTFAIVSKIVLKIELADRRLLLNKQEDRLIVLVHNLFNYLNKQESSNRNFDIFHE